MSRHQHDRRQHHLDLINESIRTTTRRPHTAHTKGRNRKEEDLFSKPLDYRDYIISPDGYEGVMLALYIAAAPYLVGLLFLFLFVAESQFEFFIEFSLMSIFVIWAIGYEVCAGVFIAWMVLLWIKGLGKKEKKQQKGKYR